MAAEVSVAAVVSVAVMAAAEVSVVVSVAVVLAAVMAAEVSVVVSAAVVSAAAMAATAVKFFEFTKQIFFISQCRLLFFVQHLRLFSNFCWINY